jgi:uncharacterized membrane protein YphA (DoxX/SURF4 family)
VSSVIFRSAWREGFSALLITKAPILWGKAALFAHEFGWGDFMHEARTDLAQLCGSVFLLVVGAGTYSFDARLLRRGEGAALGAG